MVKNLHHFTADQIARLGLDEVLESLNLKTPVYLVHMVHEKIKYSYIHAAVFDERSARFQMEKCIKDAKLDYSARLLITDLGSLLNHAVITDDVGLDCIDYDTAIDKIKFKFVH